MKKILVSITISSVFLFGCSNSSDSANTASDATADNSVMPEAPIITNVPAQVPLTDSSILATSLVSPTGVPVQTSTTGNTGPNPAHGEPGHRCDIAVGAPLNSQPTAPAAPQAAAPTPGLVTGTPAAPPAPGLVTGTPPVAPAPAPAPVVTAPGTNPPHGQPGHDCKIAVGAPLPK